MKVLAKRLISKPKYTRVLEWGKMLGITGLGQTVIQVISLISGLLVIRVLPTQEYALYTLANTMLGTMTILADGGIASGVMAQGGKGWQDREKLGIVLATGLYLRKKFAIGSLLVATPALILILRYHQASWSTTLLLILALIPAFVTALSGTLLQIPLILHQKVADLQKNQVSVNLGRLLILALSIFLFPWAFVAILASGLPQIYANLNLRKVSINIANWNAQPDNKVKKEILTVVKRILPSSIYYCLSGQLTIWLISIFGSTLALAQVGALSRLSMALSLFNSIFSTLIVPRFARLPNVPRLLIKWFSLIQVGLIIMSILIVAIVALFSQQILWILGDDYLMLNKEVILLAASSCTSLISVNTNRLLSARGIIVPPLIFISFAVISKVGIAFTVQLNEVMGVLLFSMYTSIAIYILRLSYLIFTVKKHESYI